MNDVSPGAQGGGRPKGLRHTGFRELLRRMTSTRDQLEAQELQRDAEDAGATPIAQCHERERTSVCGTLRTVTLQPRNGTPTLEAELYDGSDAIILVWLGRRRIAGIEPGRALKAEGLVSRQDERMVMFNPSYELRSVGS